MAKDTSKPTVSGAAREKSSSYPERIADKLAGLEPTPGCYLFKDAKKRVVYVGKAKSLRTRVRSYFQRSRSDNRYFIPLLHQIVADLETVVTGSEKEAAVLENELIKHHKPRFNVKLRDDKNFLCLRLDTKKPWPRLETVRRPTADGARYFGPFHSASSARKTLHLVNKHFQLRTCTDSELRSRTRPCLQYQIKRCPAPCVHEVDAPYYAEQVRSVELFLDARHDELSGLLEEKMRVASVEMKYELAAMYRDQLKAVRSIRERQRVVRVQGIDQDVVGLYREADRIEIVIMLVRQGHLTDSRSFSIGLSELPDEEVLAGFLSQYYASEMRLGVLPDELLLPVRPDAVQGLADWLGEMRGKKCKAVVPKVGPRHKLLELACENAAHAFKEKRRASDDLLGRLEKIQKKLRLPVTPRVIECCDISHLGGGDVVGAIVCMHNGQLEKKKYRTFKVKTTESGDDYAAMYEVLARRFRRGREEAREASEADDATKEGKAWELPDLFVVDGGRGQLSVAMAAANDLGLHGLAVVGLAKERENIQGETIVDRVYMPGQMNPVSLKTNSPELFLLAQLRDEAHRFANRGREKLGKKRRLRSELDDIAGIGPASRKALLRQLGSMKGVRAATDEQILAVKGLTRRHVAALRKVIPSPG